MYLLNEYYAQQHRRDLLIAAERHRLASQAARIRRWQRYAAYAENRANRARARLAVV